MGENLSGALVARTRKMRLLEDEEAVFLSIYLFVCLVCLVGLVGLVCLLWSELVWSGLVQSGLVWPCPVRSGLSGVVRSGLVCRAWSGPVRST